MTSGSTQVVHPAELHAMLQARADELAARSAERRDARARRAQAHGRRGFLAVFAAVTLLLTGALYALAVHDAGILELDGNVADAPPVDCALPAGVGPEDDVCSPTDWADFQDSNGALVPANLPAGTIAATGVIQDFVIDDSGPDPSYHEPSNKDDQGIDPAGGSDVWGCGEAANPTDKDDIINAYAIAVQPGGVGTDVYFYFGVERFDNSGTAFIGVWLFQENVGCDETLGKFTGEKKTGDILILTDFTNGGAITSLKAYRFTAGATPADPGTFALITPLGADCSAAVPNDFLCAEVNLVDATTPWPFQDKDKPGQPNPDPDNIMEISEFFEGGINLTDAFDQAGLTLPDCFGSFLAETRSADVLLGATLKDYALEDFDTCGDITAHKYHDLNANGVDDSEPALSGWTIFLDENNDETLQTEDDNCNGVLDGGEDDNTNLILDGEQCRITDGSGDVSFGELPFGSYDVCEVLQANWFNSDPVGATLCETVTVSASSDPFVDFGNFRPGTKSGVKYEDENANGTQDGGDLNLSGWTILAFAEIGAPNGDLSQAEYDAGAADSDLTDGSGYELSLNPGAYVVCEEMLSTAWTQSEPANTRCNGINTGANPALGAGGYAVVITSGSEETSNDFGNFRPGTKSGVKFNDESNDGIWQVGEPPLPGWTIKVFNDNDNSNSLNTGDTFDTSMVTAAVTGAYSFSLDPGEYIVCEVLQAGWVQTAPNNLICDFESVDATVANGGFAVTISSGSSEPNNNFGNRLPPNEGCTPGFWQGGVGEDLWDEEGDLDWGAHGGVGFNPFVTTDTFISFFPSSGDATVDGMTMIEIVGSGGTNVWPRKAARDLIAAYLNASFGIDYPYGIPTILADWNTAVANGTAGFKIFHTKYDAANNLGCPL